MDNVSNSRPYTICHILSSLDGRINGPFMNSETTRELAADYGKIRAQMNADAWLYGTTTVKEFLNYQEPAPEELARASSEGCDLTTDFVHPGSDKPYFVAMDTRGELGWESGKYANKGRPEMQVIEILTGAVPESYRAYLRERGVSYILAGQTELDCALAMAKLRRLFGIEKLLICGGGGADWTFLAAGMVDELSLVLVPATDGGSGNASVFSRDSQQNPARAVEFSLKAATELGHGGLYLCYLAKNTEK